ncbi:histidine--tRNA ligase [candidate division KSB1 bacterium]|nr:histidine--tRNA ligase [candidate division KSB1 bacterium]
MAVIKPGIPKGTRDFLPETMFRRQYVINTIRTIFEKYGYEPLETPSIERLDILSGKYGDEGDQLIFKILRRGTGIEKAGPGDRAFQVTDVNEVIDFALRYDLTVPLCRVVAMYQTELTLPFKRYQIQPVWRGERPRMGRYREFYQCDADVVGTTSMLADADNIALIHDVLTSLGFDKFAIRINNRKILTGIVEYSGVPETKGMDVLAAIDKLEKISMDGVKQELKNRDIPDAAIQKILPILEIKGDAFSILDDMASVLQISEKGLEGISETRELFTLLNELGLPKHHYAMDLYLARGLNYYTGPIYESIVAEPNVGSLTGGGRYDQLIGMFLGRDIPATGTSFGIERIIDVMTEMNMLPSKQTAAQALVTIFDETTRAASLNCAKQLRAAGIKTDLFHQASKLKKQFNYADKKGIPIVVVIGPEEIPKNEVTVKLMKTGEQSQVKTADLVAFIERI